MDFHKTLWNYVGATPTNMNKRTGFRTPLQIDKTLQDFTKEAGHPIGPVTNRSEISKFFLEYLDSHCKARLHNSRIWFYPDDLMIKYFKLDSDWYLLSSINKLIAMHIV